MSAVKPWTLTWTRPSLSGSAVSTTLPTSSMGAEGCRDLGKCASLSQRVSGGAGEINRGFWGCLSTTFIGLARNLGQVLIRLCVHPCKKALGVRLYAVKAVRGKCTGAKSDLQVIDRPMFGQAVQKVVLCGS